MRQRGSLVCWGRCIRTDRMRPADHSRFGPSLFGQTCGTGVIAAEPRQPRQSVKRHCGAGASSLTIDQWGNVLPCVQWRRAAGNIRHTPIAEIWSASAELQKVRTITVEAKKVAARFKGPAGVTLFCPGLADLLEGDPLALYPSKPPD